MAYMLWYCHRRVGLCTTIIQVSYAPCIHIFNILNCLYFLTAGLLLLLGNSFRSPRLHSTSTAGGHLSGAEELLVIPNASIWFGVCIFLPHQSHLGGRTTLVVCLSSYSVEINQEIRWLSILKLDSFYLPNLCPKAN